MRFIDLFSGIGGFRLGMEMAGHECAGHCEIDGFANRSYIAMHRPKEDEWYAGDIRAVEPWDLPEADCYCGGFPCQAFSVAGKRGGFEDTRGTLFFEIMRLARIRKPKYLFLENVKGLLSHDRGKTFGTILETLWESGYDAEWQVCNSKDFGVPQNRERVFIVGHLRGSGGQQIFPVTEKNSNVIRQIGNVMPTKNRKNPNQGRVYDVSGIGPALSCAEGGGRQPHIVEPAGIYTSQSDKFKRGPLPGISRCLKAKCSDAGVVLPVQTPVFIDLDAKGKRTETARALQARYHKGCSNRSGENSGIYDGARIRKLTPRECFRLHGFLDEYFDRAAEVNSDSQLYKQAGNSVTVNVIYAIAKRMDGV